MIKSKIRVLVFQLTLTSPIGSPSESKYSAVDSPHVESDGGGLKYERTSASLSFFNVEIASSNLSLYGLSSDVKYSKMSKEYTGND